MAFENSCWREFTHFVSDHILSNEDWNVAFPIVYAERQSDHVGRDRRASRPSSDRLRFRTAFADTTQHFLNAEVDERSFL